MIGDDETGLKGEMVDLSREDLRERLFVAEKVMKALFKRNKQLEENQTDDQNQGTQSNRQSDNREIIEENRVLK